MYVCGAERVRATLFPAREVKAVFAVNKAKLIGKQTTCLAVASACIRLYAEARKNEQFDPILRRWLRQGQMKVVVKADSSEQLVELKAAAVRLRLATSTVVVSDRVLLPDGKMPNAKKQKSPVESQSNDTKSAPSEEIAILGVLGPSDDVDQVTGSLKLM